MLLAASNFDQEDIRNFLLIVQRRNISEVLNEINELGNVLQIEELQVNSLSKSVKSDDTFLRVAQLLTTEAGLSKIKASNLLASALHERFPKRKISPFNSKSGFIAWLDALGKEFNEAEILYAASRVRNEILHSNNDDWLK